MVRGFAAEKDPSTVSATHPTDGGGCQCLDAVGLVSVIFTWHLAVCIYAGSIRTFVQFHQNAAK